MRIAFGVTGGAGFIGINLCEKLVLAGHPVVIFDDLSRVGAEKKTLFGCAKNTLTRWILSAAIYPQAKKT